MNFKVTGKFSHNVGLLQHSHFKHEVLLVYMCINILVSGMKVVAKLSLK